ncbi:acyltransferase [Halomonas sp.]|uniref:acyltransferase n=1 Tax=Halomonas sp. TaxID=1486246 RepID=UPI00257A216F|nr:acyltransferase [Halomonas sp.]MCJ8286908.1 acyltransferase [Halomonas sp.]NQY71623.1 acyltransferase [Halomonas sp.]
MLIKLILKARKKLRRFFFDVKYKGRFKGQQFDHSLRCDNAEGFTFGERCYVGPGCHFDALGGLAISDYVIIGPHVKIWTYNHDIKSDLIPYGEENLMLPVFIGRGVWVAMGAIILPGAEIGEGCIIAAGSIVKGKVPAFSIVRPYYSEHQPLDIVKRSGAYYRKKNG